MKTPTQGGKAGQKTREKRQKLLEDLRLSFTEEVILELEFGESIFR